MYGKNDLLKLLYEHQAIRYQLGWLETMIDNMLPKNDIPISNQDKPELKKSMNNLRMALYNFKEASQNHERREICIFQNLLSTLEAEQTFGEHDDIYRNLSSCILEVDMAAIENWTAQEMERCMINLKDNIYNLHRLTLNHIFKENEMMRLQLINSEKEQRVYSQSSR